MKKGFEIMGGGAEDDAEFGLQLVKSSVRDLFGNHRFSEAVALLDAAVVEKKITADQRETALLAGIRNELEKGEEWSRTIRHTELDPVSFIQGYFGGNAELQGLALHEVQQEGAKRIERLKEELEQETQRHAAITSALDKRKEV